MSTLNCLCVSVLWVSRRVQMWEETKQNKTKQDLTTGWVALQHLQASQDLHVSPEAAQEWRHVRCEASQNTEWGNRLGSGFVSPGWEAVEACCDAEQALVMLEQREVCWLKWKMVCLTPRSGGLTPPLQLGVERAWAWWLVSGATNASRASIWRHTQTNTKHTPFSYFPFAQTLATSRALYLCSFYTAYLFMSSLSAAGDIVCVWVCVCLCALDCMLNVFVVQSDALVPLGPSGRNLLPKCLFSCRVCKLQHRFSNKK